MADQSMKEILRMTASDGCHSDPAPAAPTAELPIEDVRRVLKELGIDMRPAIERVMTALAVQKLKDAEARLAALEEGGRVGPCEVCWFNAWEPTPEGPRCGHCWLRERYAALSARLRAAPCLAPDSCGKGTWKCFTCQARGGGE